MQSRGYLYAFLTVTIWSGWAIVTRLGAVGSLSVMDLAFLRFASAGLIMLPIAIKYRNLITKENRKDVFVMIIGAGLAYFLFMGLGFKLAPAGHSIITPCSMTAMVAIGSYFMFKEQFKLGRIAGYLLIIFGVIYKLSGVTNANLAADIFFLFGAVCWSIYTLFTKKHSNIPPLAVAAFVQVGSAALTLPPYAIYQLIQPHSLPMAASVMQIIYQGIFTSIISLLLYNKAIAYIGASRTASFAALLPIMVTFGAIPILGEFPSFSDIIFVVIMSVGVFFASGVPYKIRKN